MLINLGVFRGVFLLLLLNQKLYNELKKYEDHPYEKRAFLYLDILSWLESHLENRPVAQIIREKALAQKR